MNINQEHFTTYKSLSPVLRTQTTSVVSPVNSPDSVNNSEIATYQGVAFEQLTLTDRPGSRMFLRSCAWEDPVAAQGTTFHQQRIGGKRGIDG